MRRRDAGRSRGEPIVRVVLEATLEELQRAGVAGLSVERIAAASQVNKTSIYRRWATREALVAAALQQIAEQTMASIPDTQSLRGDLLAVLRPIADLMQSPPGKGLLRAAVGEAAAEEVAALARARLGERLTGPLLKLVARARQRGEWAPGVSPRLLIFTVVGAMLHRVLMEHAPIGKRWLEGVVDLVLLGVRPRARRAR